MHAQKGLTAAAINAAKPGDKPYKLYDRDRLYVLISVAGSKRWAWAYRLDGKDYAFQIGRFPDVSIIDARAARAAAAKLVADGHHPAEHKAEAIAAVKKEKSTVFWPICEEWIVENEKSWSDYYRKQVRSFMERYVRDGELGAMPISKIETPDIVAVLKGVAVRTAAQGDERKATGSPTIAILLRMWISAVFSFAMIDGRSKYNPIAGVKASKIIKRGPVKNNLALSEDEFRRLMTAIGAYGGQRVTKIMIELLALFFVRTGELRQAEWQEFDFDNRRWTVPAARMKKKTFGDHVVPLSDHAIALLKELKAITGTAKTGRDWLFRNIRRPDECMSATTVNRALERMGFNGAKSIGFSAHGFRGTASTLLHEHGFKPEIIETQLAHHEGNAVKAAYNKAKYLNDRTALMQSWSDYVSGLKTSKTTDSANATV